MRLEIKQEHIDRAIEWASKNPWMHYKEDDRSTKVSCNCIVAQAMLDAGVEYPSVGVHYALSEDIAGFVKKRWHLGENAHLITGKTRESWCEVKPCVIEMEEV